MEQTLKVEGMSCTGCEGNVRGGLLELAGVEEVVADHKGDSVRVVFDPGAVDLEVIRGRIAELGYEVTA